MRQSLPDIRHSVCLYVPVEQVWEAVATSEGMAGWFMPNSFEPTVGANFLLHSGSNLHSSTPVGVPRRGRGLASLTQ